MSTCVKRLLKMERFSRATKRYYGHRNRRRDPLDNTQVVPNHHAVAINRVEEDLPGANIDAAPSEINKIPWGPLPDIFDSPEYKSIFKMLEANKDALRAMLEGRFPDDPNSPVSRRAEADLVSASRQTALEIVKMREAAANRQRHKAILCQPLNKGKISIITSVKLRSDLQQYKFVDAPVLVNPDFLTDRSD